MKIGLISDFHMESMLGASPEKILDRFMDFLPPAESFDVIVAAGDMGYTRSVIPVLKAIQDFLKTKVVFVPGNHEFYDCGMAHPFQKSLKALQDEAEASDICLLHNQAVDFPDFGVSVWGSPWYTDFSRTEEDVSGIGIADYYKTWVEDGSIVRRITPKDHVAMNLAAQGSLQEWLSKCIERGLKPVVATHWGPSEKGAHGMFPKDDKISAYFTTDYLDRNHWRFPPGSVWMHGHTHFNVDCQVGNVRLCTNQLGYSGARRHSSRDPASPEEVCLTTYDPMKYLEV